VVAGHEHAVALEADVPIGVAGKLEHAPAPVDLVAFASNSGSRAKRMKGRERPRLLPQLVCHLVGKPVPCR